MLSPIPVLSAAFVHLGIVVSNTLICPPKFSLTSCVIFFDRLVLSFVIVINTPSIFKSWLRFLLTILIDLNKSAIPSTALGSACTVITTLSEAVRALIGRLSSDGFVSIMT